ncbi:hypothetical protein WT59_21990 [Burkholderia territorii]|uniref:flagellar hook-length control protein FliK n=1 Tax=Burkholderia territorii TaxID=1503055 RepID=UPI00075DE5E1|nr:flagellar hook-length control protein FliK [Burkholderia territorii]KWH08479.1 hypothetical protein WT59_21990 [Burkholderia territorii]
MNWIGLLLHDRALQSSLAERIDRPAPRVAAMPSEQDETEMPGADVQPGGDDAQAPPSDDFAQVMATFPATLDVPTVPSAVAAPSSVEATDRRAPAVGQPGNGAMPEPGLPMAVSPANGIAFRASPLIEAASRPHVSEASQPADVHDAGRPPGAASEAALVAAPRSTPRAERSEAPGSGEQGAADKPAAAPAVPQNVAAVHREPAGAVQTAAPAAPVRWGTQMMNALGDRINVQMRQGVDQAVIRLDPQSMGTVHIAIRHEAGAIQVQLVASHEEVARQLQTVSEALRQELSVKQSGDVTVVVRHGQSLGQDERGQSNHQEAPRERRPGKALHEADADDGDTRFGLEGRH